MLKLQSRRFYFTLLTLLGCTTVLSATDVLMIRGMDMGTSISNATADPNVLLTQDTAQGELTHLGRYTMRAQELVNVKTLQITSGEFTLTTATGDTLTGMYSGTGKPSNTPNVITYDVAGPITGGTGRFAHANGVMLFLGTTDLVTGVFSDQVVGVVTGL